MIILSNLLYAVAMILDMILGFVLLLVIARAILSWVNPDPHNAIVRFLHSSTDPFINPLRRKFSFLCPGGMDFTPLALLLIIYFLRYFLVNVMFDYARLLKV
jgi:YggT family protein